MIMIKWLRVRGRQALQIVHLVVLFVLIGTPSIFLYAVRYHSHDSWRVTVDVVAYVVMYLLIIVYAAYVYRKNDQQPPTRPGVVNWVVGGYLAIMLGNLIFSQLNALLYHQTSTANNEAINSLMHSNHVVMVTMAIGACTLAPVAEELVFRGVLMNVLFARDWFWLKVIVSGLVFSAAHASTNPVSFLIYAYLGGVLAFVYRKSGKLRNSMLLHGLNNVISMLVLLG